MKVLFLNRHAKSSWANQSLSDFHRPLNKRGKRDAPLMAKRLREREPQIEHFVTSPAVRAATTAESIAKEYGKQPREIIRDERLYLAGVNELVKIINQLPDSSNSAILFGHNPGLTDLLFYLTGNFIDNIPTCGVTRIDFEIDTWQAVTRNLGILSFFDFPKNYLSNKS